MYSKDSAIDVENYILQNINIQEYVKNVIVRMLGEKMNEEILESIIKRH